MMDVFEKFDQDLSGNVSASELTRVLKYMGFNPSQDMVDDLVKKADADGSGEIDKAEFPTAMRVYVEIQTEQFRVVFMASDEDGSGQMDVKEVYDCVKELGWFPTEESIAEAVKKVDTDGAGEIDFDEFYSLMGHLRKTEGFTVEELENMTNIFNKFDIDGSGEISTLELSAAVRENGYPTSLDVLQNVVAEIDVDGSGEIDLGEMLKLFRKYRNREMMEAEKLFLHYGVVPGAPPPADAEEGQNAPNEGLKVRDLEMEVKLFPKMLPKLGWTPSEAMMEKQEELLPAKSMCSWREFLLYLGDYRKLELAESKRRAGFSEDEVAFYRETFDSYDKDGGGELTLRELFPLLKALDKEPKNVIQRDKLTALLAEIDEDGSGEIGFSEFLQLMRRFLDESDAAALLKEREIIQRTGFLPDEVTAWRDIFLKFDEDKSGAFDVGEGKTLLQAVGINLNERAMHDRYLQIFHEVDEDDDGNMDFPEFLLIMRRLIDMDFGGIASRTQRKEPAEQTSKEKKAALRKQRRSGSAPGGEGAGGE
jgi:calmodulin